MLSMSMSMSLYLWGVVAVASLLSHAHDADARAIHADTSEWSPVSSTDDLEYDENDKLAKYHLVFPSADPEWTAEGNDCASRVLALGGTGKIYGVAKVPLAGEALRQVFPDWNRGVDAGSCQAAVLVRGLDRSMAGYPMPDKRYYSESDSKSDSHSHTHSHSNLNDWYHKECIGVELCLMNYLDDAHPLEVYWVSTLGDTRGQHVPTQTLQFGERHTRCFHSFLGHQFVVKDHFGRPIDSPLASFTVNHPLILGFGQAPQHIRDPVPANHFDQTIADTLHHEWARHEVPTRTFSPLGFAKGRLPNDVFGDMAAFFYNNRRNKYREEWGGKGVFVNWWQSDVFMMQIPWKLKGIWQIRLASLVSHWVGMECEQTVMYGLRQYEAGARLLTHVDRLSTHVVSLIVNVAQGNLAQDWPVEVYDHAGRLHEVVMEAGDIVYYESAKALHSRNRPLMGDGAYYVNLFTHYRPLEMGPEWYKLDTPEDKKPLLDLDLGGDGVDGDVDLKDVCTVPENVTGKDTEYLGYGKVRCPNHPQLGKNLSPSLFVAKSGMDLIEWWKRIAPEGEDHSGVGREAEERKKKKQEQQQQQQAADQEAREKQRAEASTESAAAGAATGQPQPQTSLPIIADDDDYYSAEDRAMYYEQMDDDDDQYDDDDDEKGAAGGSSTKSNADQSHHAEL